MPVPKMTTYMPTYEEFEGKKGGRNVASLIMYHLQRMGFLDAANPYKELNLIMDNCSGQNKNQMVLRLVPYLVEMGYFSKVNFIFLVVGHTKNPCDRLFNLCKKAYRKSQVFIMDQLVDASNGTTHVSGCRVSADIMKDYQKGSECEKNKREILLVRTKERRWAQKAKKHV
jgi:hypothetical protein